MDKDWLFCRRQEYTSLSAVQFSTDVQSEEELLWQLSVRFLQAYVAEVVLICTFLSVHSRSDISVVCSRLLIEYMGLEFHNFDYLIFCKISR